jgi:2-polyprenyl-3-methyl-5-hydroxy-6-metoxy-1,4-benzoquinol methylase
MNIFAELERINTRPQPFEFYTASDLWADEHTSQHMLAFHLNENLDVSSRRPAFLDRSVEWMVAFFHLGDGKKVADFGCGPGLYATRLAKKGANVTAIDFSKRSIQYAQDVAAREQLSIHYIHHNYLEFTTDARFHLIMMIMCDICALSPMQRKSMLHKFHALLEPGGYVLLDAYSVHAFEQRQEATRYDVHPANGFWSPKKYYEFLNTFTYAQERVVLDKYTVIEADRTRTVYNWLQYFTPEALGQEFMEAGFIIDARYADVAGSPFDPTAKEFAIVAKKP